MGIHIALHIIDDPVTDERFAPGDVVSPDTIEHLGEDAINSLLFRRSLFYLCDDPMDEPQVQWQVWGGAYPQLLRELVLTTCTGYADGGVDAQAADVAAKVVLAVNPEVTLGKEPAFDPDPSDKEELADQLSKLTKPELVEIAKGHGLSTAGTRHDLIDRIVYSF